MSNLKNMPLKDLEKILDHLDQYPLITQKLADFQLFKQAYKLVLNKQHLKLDLLFPKPPLHPYCGGLSIIQN